MSTYIERANLAWLGLDNVEDIYCGDIFSKIHHTDEMISAYEFIKIITRPDYLHALCKEILDIQLLPIQNVMLQEMWNRKFPMLIASRGFGKSFSLAVLCILKSLLVPGMKVVITGAGFRQAKLVYEYVENIWANADVLRNICSDSSGSHKDTDRWTFKINDSTIVAIPMGCMSPDTLITTKNGIYTLSSLRINEDKNYIWSNGKFRKQGFFYDSGISPSYEVITKSGFRYVATPNHRMKVAKNNQIIWIRTDRLETGDRILIDRSIRWHENDTEISEEDAYCLGLMIGDGCYSNNKKLRYTSSDPELHSKSLHVGDFRLNKDGIHSDLIISDVRKWFNLWDMKPAKASSKELPQKILNSSKNKMAACLRGLFDTDGHFSILSRNKEPSGNLGFTTTSELLATQIQYILTHFGIIARISYRDRVSPRSGKAAQRCYDLRICGNDIEKFSNQIGFGLKRKQNILDEFIKNRKRKKSYHDTIPLTLNLLPKEITHSRKNLTFDRASECNLSHELVNSNYYYDEILLVSRFIDQPMYDINIPDGNEYCAGGFFSHNTGDKIRGLRANLIVAEEFNSLEPSIYETVVQGFASVRAKPVEQVMLAAKREHMIKEGVWTDEQQQIFEKRLGNQSIISGTAGYDFQHFAQYWKKYHSIIEGDRQKMAELLGPEMADEFDPADFSIIRIPYELIPKGFMDDKQIARAKATVHSGVFLSEYGAVFVKDSDGFYKRTLIESCVAKESNKISDTKGNTIVFDVALKGKPGHKYIIGVDPAASRDNLAIVVIELHDDHWRIVYVWTTNEKQHRQLVKDGKATHDNYYSFCARKIRDLMLVFPTVRIGVDGQGGGKAIIEALHDKSVMNEGEEQLWPVIDPEKEQDSDDKKGAHIIEKVEFADSKWTSEANNGMRKDMEMKYLLFPRYDGLSLSLAAQSDLENLATGRNFESIEGVIAEIEELKNELSTIIMTQTTQSERDKWDTPEIKEGTGKKGRLKKDRYSALLIANMIARSMSRNEPAMVYAFIGGTTKDLAAGRVVQQDPYYGSSWYDDVDPNMFTAVSRKPK
jgi:intein/homing endonuclease